jgi:hypothetical protein
MQTLGKYPNAKLLIEDAGSGTSLIQDLQSEGLSVHANRPVGDKVVRMSAQTARIEEGRVLLPESAPWLESFARRSWHSRTAAMTTKSTPSRRPWRGSLNQKDGCWRSDKKGQALVRCAALPKNSRLVGDNTMQDDDQS